MYNSLSFELEFVTIFRIFRMRPQLVGMVSFFSFIISCFYHPHLPHCFFLFLFYFSPSEVLYILNS